MPVGRYLREHPELKYLFFGGKDGVGDPLALAEFVLGANNGWSRPAIDAALSAETRRVVQLARRVQVVVFCTTAVADRHGRALFMRDIYGEDRKLLAATAPRRAGLRGGCRRGARRSRAPRGGGCAPPRRRCAFAEPRSSPPIGS